MERLFAIPLMLTLAFSAGFVGCAFASDDQDINHHYDKDATLHDDMTGRNVNLNADKNLNAENKIEAQQDANLKSGGNTHIGGTITAGRINIKAGGSVNLDGHIQGGDVNIQSGGDMNLSNTIDANRVKAQSGQNMTVNQANITGKQGVDLSTKGDGQLWVKEGSNLNAPDGKVNLESKNLRQEGTVHDQDRPAQ